MPINPDGREVGCYVYMILVAIGDRIFVKIGRSADPLQRLSQVCTGCPVRPKVLYTVSLYNPFEARQVKKLLHSRAARWHSHGEWFELTLQDRDEFRRVWRSVFARFSKPSRRLTTWTRISIEALDRQAQEDARKRGHGLRRLSAAHRDFTIDKRVDDRRAVK